MPKHSFLRAFIAGVAMLTLSGCYMKKAPFSETPPELDIPKKEVEPYGNIESDIHFTSKKASYADIITDEFIRRCYTPYDGDLAKMILKMDRIVKYNDNMYKYDSDNPSQPTHRYFIENKLGQAFHLTLNYDKSLDKRECMLRGAIKNPQKLQTTLVEALQSKNPTVTDECGDRSANMEHYQRYCYKIHASNKDDTLLFTFETFDNGNEDLDYKHREYSITMTH